MRSKQLQRFKNARFTRSVSDHQYNLAKVVIQGFLRLVVLNMLIKANKAEFFAKQNN